MSRPIQPFKILQSRSSTVRTCNLQQASEAYQTIRFLSFDLLTIDKTASNACSVIAQGHQVGA